MNKVLIGLTIAAALTITGCATTPSKPRTFDQLGQYTTVPLNDHSYRISFQGNSNMSFGTAEEIAPTVILLASDPGGNLYVGQTLGPNSGDVMP